LAEWFCDDSFCGCAFINSVGELGARRPDIVEVAQRDKRKMVSVVAGLIAPSAEREQDAQAMVLTVD
jgi:hypothetical protein